VPRHIMVCAAIEQRSSLRLLDRCFVQQRI
jgi:hypothetical protein